MKTLICIVLAFSSAFAGAQTLDGYIHYQLNCGRAGQPEWLRVDMALSPYATKGRPFPVSGYIQFNYASTNQMTCMEAGRGPELNVNCVGYYHFGREITELKVRGSGDNIVAKWRTPKIYGSQQVTSKCTLACLGMNGSRWGCE